MSKKKYADEPINKIKIISDFLPTPQELILKEETVRVTLMLSKESINYFKREAGKHHAHYQAMIRTLLDKYARHYEDAANHSSIKK